jgi:hypothetical protein
LGGSKPAHIDYHILGGAEPRPYRIDYKALFFQFPTRP